MIFLFTRSTLVSNFWTEFLDELTNIWKKIITPELSEAATGGVLSKKVFLDISQNSQENTYARASFLTKLQA